MESIKPFKLLESLELTEDNNLKKILKTFHNYV